MALYENNLFSEALDMFQAALKIDDKIPEVRYNFANCLFNLGREQEAIGHYQMAIENIKPERRQEYHFNLANALSLNSRFEEAITQYTLALECTQGESVNTAQTHFNLGNTY
jgi:tetratricopeptide (TPR) repeat protein